MNSFGDPKTNVKNVNKRHIESAPLRALLAGLMIAVVSMESAGVSVWHVVVFKDTPQPINKFIRIQRLFQAYGYVISEGLLQFGMKLTFREDDDAGVGLFALQFPQGLVGHPDVVQVQDNGSAVTGTQVRLQVHHLVHLDGRKMLADKKFAETPALTTVTVKNDDLFFHAHDASKRNYGELLLELETIRGVRAIAVPFQLWLMICHKVVDHILAKNS